MKQIYLPTEIAKALQVTETTVLRVLPSIQKIKVVKFGRFIRIDKMSFNLWFHGDAACSDAFETYTPRQIADILEVNLRNVYTQLKTTDAFRVLQLGRTVRIHKDTFDHWFSWKGAVF